MTEFEGPSELLRRIYDEEFGFLPTNSSMKPVHMANGIARRLLNTQYTYTPLARVLRQFVENQRGGFRDERNPNEEILEDYGNRFSDRHGNPPSDEQLTRFRALVRDTLGADDAVFPTQASFTLSHERMITADISDNGLGDLLAAVLTAGPADKQVAASLMKELLATDTDPWTNLAWPLMDLLEARDAGLTESMVLRANRRSALVEVDDAGLFKSPTLRRLRERYDQLAFYERDHGSKLTTLRRLVLFGAFATHVHMVRRAFDATGAAPIPPLLLDMFDGRRRSLRDASAATLQSGFRTIERLVLERICGELEVAAGRDVDAFVEGLPGTAVWDAVRTEFQGHLGSHEPLNALAEAFWKVGYSALGPKEVQGFPWNTLLALGRRAGYLLPYDNRGRGGKEHKRYGASAEFAELLVISTVRPESPLDFDEFLDKLRTSFGILIGRPADFAAIRSNDLRDDADLDQRRAISVLESDLRANLLAFQDLIKDIGFARSYADGRTVVSTAEAP